MYTHQTIPNVQPVKVKNRQAVQVLFEETIVALKWHPSQKVQRKGEKMEALLLQWKESGKEADFAVLRSMNYKYKEIRDEYTEYLVNKPYEWTKSDTIATGAVLGGFAALVGGLIAWDAYDQAQEAKRDAKRIKDLYS